MKHLTLKIVFAVLCLLIGLGAALVVPASAQCIPRTDWNPYTVMRGDTIYGIARRFGTTSSNLIQGNCLANPNYLLAGQTLRVPPAAGSGPWSGGVPEFPYAASHVGTTYQLFEHGFMLWKADTGSIWVFINQGRAGGIVRQYPLSIYGGLSGDAGTMQDIPPGYGLPILGFKKVYDNFPDVRSALGWAAGGEVGFLMAVQPSGSGSYFTIALWDGRRLRINSDQTWQRDTGTLPPPEPTPPPPVAYSMGATFQSFQNGFMVWREDTGDIRVFIGTTSGELTLYPLSYYGPLPGRTIMPPESGRQFFIAFGFAKVWSNVPGVKERLGYATGGEQGYTMLFNTLVSRTPPFTIPGGYEVYNVSGSTWAVAVSPGASPMPYGEVSPTPTSPPDADGPQVSLFAVSPADVMPGDTVTISWEVYNAGNIAIKALYKADYRLFLDYTSEVFPASSGSTTITIPTHTDVYNTDATIQLYLARDAAPENWQLLDRVTRTVRIGCPVALAWGAPGGCGQEPVKLISALYQPFERGFMLFLMDIDGAYDGVYTVILDDEHQTGYTFESQPVTPRTPPEGLFAPDAVFVETWSRSPQYEQALGWATGPAQPYTASAQTKHYTIRDPSTIRENYVTLPDGRVIRLSGSVLGGPALRWDWVG